MGSPAFQFYPDDFLGSGKVGTMTAAEVGIYVLLLCYDWNNTGLEFSPKRLARFCRVTEAEFLDAWEAVGPCFTERGGRLYNPRLDREREKQAAFRAKQVAAGVASAAARLNRRSTSVGTVVQPDGNSPSPSPAPATTGRSRAEKPTTTYVPAEPFAPKFCADCGDGVLSDIPGQRRPIRVHAASCPHALHLSESA